MNTAALTPKQVANRNRRVGLMAGAMAVAMLGMGFAAVPFYRWFCAATGFNGTTMRATLAEAAKVKAGGGTISIRFDANVDRGMGWEFKPENNVDTVEYGARDMAFFSAKNLTNAAITGTASFNVEPGNVGKYFKKIQCFCFTQQTLAPHEAVRMPVIFYVDPAILKDPDARDIEEITLSYTFHVVPQSQLPASRIPASPIPASAISANSPAQIPAKPLDRVAAAR
jgi:cytochrome c oxidase assembly protein subunit 11